MAGAGSAAAGAVAAGVDGGALTTGGAAGGGSLTRASGARVGAGGAAATTAGGGAAGVVTTVAGAGAGAGGAGCTVGGGAAGAIIWARRVFSATARAPAPIASTTPQIARNRPFMTNRFSDFARACQVKCLRWFSPNREPQICPFEKNKSGQVLLWLTKAFQGAAACAKLSPAADLTVGTLRYLGVTALAALLCLSASAQADLVVNLSKSQQRL